MKLSEMWRQAAKELKQGKYVFYDPETDTHCAHGALIHYTNGHESCSSAGTGRGLFLQSDDVFEAVLKFNDHTRIIKTNDELGWSFEDFAKKAEELGL